MSRKGIDPDTLLMMGVKKQNIKLKTTKVSQTLRCGLPIVSGNTELLAVAARSVIEVQSVDQLTTQTYFNTLGADGMKELKNELEHGKSTLDVKMASLGSFTYHGKKIDEGIKFLQEAKDKLNNMVMRSITQTYDSVSDVTSALDVAIGIEEGMAQRMGAVQAAAAQAAGHMRVDA